MRGVPRTARALSRAASNPHWRTHLDTLNPKGAVFAILEEFDALGVRLPIMISGTITDQSGRTLTGQTPEAFYNSLRHAAPLSFGLNCALGPSALRPYLQELSTVCEYPVNCHPNAGLPNEFGGYDLAPEDMAATWRFSRAPASSTSPGVCGTTPTTSRDRHAVDGVAPRQSPTVPSAPASRGSNPSPSAPNPSS